MHGVASILIVPICRPAEGSFIHSFQERKEADGVNPFPDVLALCDEFAQQFTEVPAELQHRKAANCKPPTMIACLA